MTLKVNEYIELEPLSLSHVKDIFTTIDKYRDILRQWLPFVDYTKEEKDSREFVEFSALSNDRNFVIFYKGLFAGLVGIKDMDTTNNKAELGYWVSPKFQNRGLATSVSGFLIKYCFTELNLNRLQIRIAIDNEKSLRVAEKLNFRFEGIERDGELLVSGYTDLKVLSLLKKEFTLDK
jgi:ribosomal-protein-serine acetyltransferase